MSLSDITLPYSAKHFCFDLSWLVPIRKYLQNHMAHKIHIFCPIEINEINRAENVNFVCQMVLQVFSYKKQTLQDLISNRVAKLLDDR